MPRLAIAAPVTTLVVRTSVSIRRGVSVSKIAIVTGGSRGIGKAAALAAAAAGYDVAISYRHDRARGSALAISRGPDRAAAAEAVRQIGAHGRRGLAVAADSADEGAVVDLFAAVDRQLGLLDALVNNAGIVGRGCRVDEITADDVNRVLAINVTGCFTAAREAVKRMSTRHGGRGGGIVHHSSAPPRPRSPRQLLPYAAPQ